MSNLFEIRKELILPASPDQVWHAVATTEGQAGWSPDPYTSTEGHTVEQEAPSRLAIRTPTEANGAFHHFEYLLTPHKDGTAFTFIHSGNLGEDWQADFDFEELTSYGWNLYMHNLQQYLTHFAGRAASFVTGQAREYASTHQAWVQLEQALGLEKSATQFTVGDPIRLTPEGLPAIEGVIDYVEPSEDFLAVRSDNGLYQFHSMERMGMSIAFGHYLYRTSEAEVVERQTVEQSWQDWLNRVFDERPSS